MCWLEPCAAQSTAEQSRKECLGRAGSAGWPAEWGGLVLYNVNTETRSLQTNNKYLLSEYQLLNCYCLHPLSGLPKQILNTDTPVSTLVSTNHSRQQQQQQLFPTNHNYCSWSICQSEGLKLPGHSCLQPIGWYYNAAGLAQIQSAETHGGRGSLSCAQRSVCVYGVWIVFWGTEYYLYACYVLVMYLYLCGMHLLGEARTGTLSVYIWQTGDRVRWGYSRKHVGDTHTCLVEVATLIREIFHNTWRRPPQGPTSCWKRLLAISVFIITNIVKTFAKFRWPPLVA